MFEFFIARRYLRAKRKQVVISVITVISVIGVAAGVMALVIALAINTGFQQHAYSATCWAPRRTSRFRKKNPAPASKGGNNCREARGAAACEQRHAGTVRHRLSQRTGAQRRREIKGISVKPGRRFRTRWCT